jgi:hypothetical protein
VVLPEEDGAGDDGAELDGEEDGTLGLSSDASVP